jgi:hypothetical protein
MSDVTTRTEQTDHAPLPGGPQPIPIDTDRQPPAGPVRDEAINVSEMPRPGEPGYAPPARIAPAAGQVLTRDHLGYTGGSDATVNVHGEVPLAMPPPAPPNISSWTSYMRPSTLDAQTCRVVFRKAWSDLTAWVKDLPHQMFGEDAVAVQFIRDLDARKQAQATAANLGRTLEPDAVDKAEAAPPSEYFQLRHLARQAAAMRDEYEAALGDYRGSLNDERKGRVEAIMREFQPLMEGPASPDDVPKSDEDSDDDPRATPNPDVTTPPTSVNKDRIAQPGVTPAPVAEETPVPLPEATGQPIPPEALNKDDATKRQAPSASAPVSPTSQTATDVPAPAPTPTAGAHGPVDLGPNPPAGAVTGTAPVTPA